MSSLYRCRARVGYRPFGSDQLIVFDERQIQELNVKLKWQPNMAFANADRSSEATVATNALSQSTCSVTISDPYLTGLAWPALFDAASIYTQANIASANNILLPACEEGQDPLVDKCHKFVDVETDNTTDQGGSYAFLLISLWYEVKGTSFGTDFYFRVSGFSVSHGTKYPSVTIRGVEARSVLFNQSLVNVAFNEGDEIEKVLQDLAKEQGYQVSFCANTNEFPDKKRLLPRSVRYTGVTTDEVIKKVINSVNGNTLSMPTREYANKISMCTRGEVEQGCSVFYLGRGLYEGYEISGQPELTLLALNREQGHNRNNSDPYKTNSFKASEYYVNNVTPKRREEQMSKVKKPPFPELFSPTSRHINRSQSVTGYVWRQEKPAGGSKTGAIVVNEETKKISARGVNLYGIRPNGNTAISFLNGIVREADSKEGRVVVETKWALRVCEKEGSEKCFNRRILQESTGLQSVKVKAKDELKISQEIGTSTEDKPEFTRFFIENFEAGMVTINPTIVWKWAIPEEDLPELQKKTPEANTGTPGNSPKPQELGAGTIVGRVGSTGNSSGPHVHIQESRGSTLSEAQLRTLAGKYVTVAGKSLTSYGQGDGFGAGRGHKGLDYPIKEGEPISVTGNIVAAGAGVGGSGCGNGLAFQPPEGPELLICHLKDNSIPPNIAGLSLKSGGNKTNLTQQSSPTTQGLMIETGFKGVPRALRIIPGRTILSFITNYDEWVEQNRPSSLDPGIWIPNRFKNWFVSECEYRWRDGDVRVQIEGVSAWGTTKITVPTFENYLSTMREAGTIDLTKNYYDYIRSIGDLHWKLEDGKDSTEAYCPEAQALSASLGQGQDSTSPTNTQGSYPQGDCRTGNAAQDSVINALYSAGLKTPNAFAGVLGNFQKESGINFNVHNGSSPGSGCSGTPSNVLGKTGYGLAQWCGSRADDLANKYKCGRNCSLDQQLSFLVGELQSYKGMISQMNNAKSAGDAAIIFRRDFERPSAPDSQDRRDAAESIVKNIKCAKPS